MNITIDTNLDEQVEKVKELMHYLKEIEKTTDLLRFITIEEFSNITGWSIPTVQKLYNRPDFPSTDYGKEKKAEIPKLPLPSLSPTVTSRRIIWANSPPISQN